MHDHNEKLVINKISKYQKNCSIVLISDAGSPLISDPGYNLVRDFIKKGIKVISVPGANSIIPSLQVSGLPISSFIFLGFVPKNKSETKSLIQRIIEYGQTAILFISGNRINKFLELIKEKSKNFDIVVCKELTKINELIIRGNIEDIANKVATNEINLKGEFTLVVRYTLNKQKKIIDENVKLQTKKLLKKYTLTETVEIVHILSNISKKDIYKVALKLKND